MVLRTMKDSPIHSVLLIDDDAMVRDSLAEYLCQLEFEVFQAESGDKGLELFQQKLPDVVLCDLKMPQIDGIAVLKEIAHNPEGIPIIVISGEGTMSDVVDALRFGASDYLIKPIIDLEVLEHAISRCIAQRQLWKENRRYRQQLEETNLELKASLMALEQDQQAGRHVQMKMLPKTPMKVGDFELSHLVIPSLYLSGDFVEYFKVGDDQLVFFIADVSGHGASSAFVTVMLKNLFARKRSDFLHRNDATVIAPAAMLDRANSELLAMDIGKHVTMCVAVVDMVNSELCYSVAGHLPLPVLSTEGASQYLQGEGPPVGLFVEAVYNEQRITLPKRFMLTLFSDGILEVLSPERDLIADEKRLLELMAEGQRSVERVVTTLGLEHLSAAPDDVAILLLARLK